MNRQVWKRDEPDSPCKNICTQHPIARICTGCYRRADEVRDWARYTHQERMRIQKELPDRKHLLKVRRGGRKGRVGRIR